MSFQAMFDPDATEQELRLAELFTQDQSQQTKITAGFNSLQQLGGLHKQLSEMQHEPVDPRAMAMAQRTYLAATEHFGVLAEDIPALEALTESTQAAFLSVSMESIVRTISETIRRIIEFLMKAFRWIGDMLGQLLTMEQYQRARLIHARARVRGLQGIRSSGIKVKLGKRAVLLCTEHAAPKTGQDLVKFLREMQGQLNAVRVEYLPMVFTTVDGLMSDAARLDAYTDRNEWLERLNEHATTLSVEPLQRRLRQMRTLNDPRFARGSVQSSAPLPGCRSLILVNPQQMVSESNDPMERAFALQQFSVVLDRVYPDKIVDRMQDEIELLNAQLLNDTLAEVDRILKELHAGINGGLKRSVVKTQNLLRTVEKQLSALDPENSKSLERGMQYMRLARDWITKPYLPLVSLALSVSTASIDLCQRHMTILEKSASK